MFNMPEKQLIEAYWRMSQKSYCRCASQQMEEYHERIVNSSDLHELIHR